MLRSLAHGPAPARGGLAAHVSALLDFLTGAFEAPVTGERSGDLLESKPNPSRAPSAQQLGGLDLSQKLDDSSVEAVLAKLSTSTRSSSSAGQSLTPEQQIDFSAQLGSGLH